MNVRAEHWIVCDAHKVKWRIGSNLFSCWKDENESVWLRNAERFLGYSKVEPLPEGTWSSDATVREWQLASVRFKFDGIDDDGVVPVEVDPGDPYSYLPC